MKKRIFVAVDISDEARRKVADYIETLRNKFPRLRVGWDKPEKLHLTLKFIGDTDEKQLETLDMIVEKIASEISNFKFQISNTGVFPSVKNARVLWIDILDEKGSLAELNRQIEIECVKNGFPREKRNYKSHLTIARLREPHLSGKLVENHLQTNFEPVEMEVSAIVIYESRLQPTGSIYSIVQSYGFSREKT